jgi:ketosteroid isomerase-like protein
VAGRIPAMSDLDDFRSTMLARQVEAEQAMVLGDAGPRMELWSRRDPVTLFGAAGMSKAGWDELSRIFPWVASRFSNVSDFRFDIEVADVSGDLAYTIGYERFNGSIDGRPVEPITVRVTHVYRREEGEWKIVHRHGDNPPPEQSPPMNDPTG